MCLEFKLLETTLKYHFCPVKIVTNENVATKLLR